MKAFKPILQSDDIPRIYCFLTLLDPQTYPGEDPQLPIRSPEYAGRTYVRPRVALSRDPAYGRQSARWLGAVLGLVDVGAIPQHTHRVGFNVEDCLDLIRLRSLAS